MGATEENDDEGIPSPSSSWDAYQPILQKAALTATKRAYLLPSDMTFQRTIDKNFGNGVDTASARILALTNKLLRFAQGSSMKGKGKGVLRQEEDLLDGYHTSIVDVMDRLFELTDRHLDEFSGPSKPTQTPEASKTKGPTASPAKPPPSGRLDPALLHASNLVKPQLSFKRPVDNSNTKSGRPKLKTKLNASVPMDYVVPQDHEMDGYDEDTLRSLHPYFYEISHLKYPSRMFEVADPIPVASFDDTPFTYVQTRKELDQMLVLLRKAREIAVDLEHHSYRTFSGFVCLMQISTRENDWVVDTLALRGELEELNEVFTDPEIIKVFHGAESDIVWLQQDFNLYVVNLFDTYHASRLLGGFPKNGLASLLEHFCDFQADKRYQLADWRIRPLPEEFLFYARSDTHFLLFVYDNLRNLLLERSSGAEDSVRQVLKDSEQTALRVYEPEIYDAETGRGLNGWDILSKKYGRPPSGTTRAIFIAAHAWRDRVSRELDESTRYVLPNHHLFRLAESPPKDLAALFTVVFPTPPVVRDRATELLAVLKTAAERAEEELHLQNKEIPTDAPAVVQDVSVNLGLTLPDVWAVPSSSGVARTSSLLEDTPPATPLAQSFVASSSTLFGDQPSTVLLPDVVSSSLSRYNDILQRIHSSLVIVPRAPVAPIAVETAPADPEALVMPATVPFIPAAQREPVTTNNPLIVRSGVTLNVDGTVAVRSSSKKKRNNLKRKASDAVNEALSPALGETSTSGSSGKLEKRGSSEEDADMDAVEPFDYASAPNLLDNDQEENVPSQGRKSKKQKTNREKKSKEKKEPVIQYGNFPAPPRNRAEPKGGNISHSFK